MYGVEGLKADCELELIPMLDVERVCDVLALAENYSCQRLSRVAARFLQVNLGAVGKTEGWVRMIRALWNHYEQQHRQRQSEVDDTGDVDIETIGEPPEKRLCQ